MAQLSSEPGDDAIALDRVMTLHMAAASRAPHLFQSWSADMSTGKSRLVGAVQCEEDPGAADDAASIATRNSTFEDWIADLRAAPLPPHK